MHDQPTKDSSIRILTLLDKYTKERLEAFAVRSFRANDVIEIIVPALQLHGQLTHLHSDNSPELVPYAIQD